MSFQIRIEVKAHGPETDSALSGRVELKEGKEGIKGAKRAKGTSKRAERAYKAGTIT